MADSVFKTMDTDGELTSESRCVYLCLHEGMGETEVKNSYRQGTFWTPAYFKASSAASMGKNTQLQDSKYSFDLQTLQSLIIQLFHSCLNLGCNSGRKDVYNHVFHCRCAVNYATLFLGLSVHTKTFSHSPVSDLKEYPLVPGSHHVSVRETGSYTSVKNVSVRHTHFSKLR